MHVLKVSKSQQKNLRNRLRRLLSPPPEMLPSEWAEANMFLPPDSPEPGRYRCDRLPWQKAIMDSFVDKTVTDIVVMGPAQSMGKTQIELNMIGYFVKYCPTSIFVCYPTLSKAQSWSRRKLAKVVEATPVLRDVIGDLLDGKKRDGQTALCKTFPGGSLFIGGANSPVSLRGDSTRIVFQDELDAFKKAAGGDSGEESGAGESDPSAMADRRAENFADAVRCYISTPLWKGSSRIERKFEESDQHHWHVPCPHCSAEQVLKWDNLKFEKENPAEARYICDSCAGEWTDKQRISAILKGKWVAHNPGSMVRGFRLNGLSQLMGKKRMFKNFLHQFAVNYLKARAGGTKTYMEWVNQFLAESFEDEGEVITSDPIFNRREDYDLDEVPEEVLVITAQVDTQDDRWELEFVGFGLGEETWGLGHHVIMGKPGTGTTEAELATLLEKKFKHPCGAMLSVATTFIDSGGLREIGI